MASCIGSFGEGSQFQSFGAVASARAGGGYPPCAALRIALSVAFGVIASGSRRISISAGLPACSARSKRRRELLRGFDEFAVRAERTRVRGEVGIDERRAVDAARVFALLVHADRAVHAVVDDDDHDVELVLHRRRELLARHEEAAVAREADHRALRYSAFAPMAAG